MALAALFAAAPAHASFTPEAGSPYPLGGVASFGVVSADFDGSGRPDVAVINGTSSNMSVLLRAGSGFAAESGSPFATGSGPDFGAAADFNGDGRPDVAVANFVSGTASVMLRQAGGGFATEAGSPGGGLREGGLAAADFNGDGRPDLAIANWDNASISIFLRQAAGGFVQEGTAIPVGTNPRYITAADFNGDGRPDLAVSNFGSSTVSILLRGASGFTLEGSAIPVGTSPVGLAAADFNGDGLNDLAVANSGSASVTVLLRQAGGGFAAEASSPITVGAAPIGIRAADFNGDGKPDLAVASNSAGQVTVLLRQAGGGFAADAGSPMSVANAYDLAAADFDGDGRADVAVSQDAPATLAVLLNTTPLPTPAPAPVPLAAPVPGKSVVVKVVSGTVRIKRPGQGYVVLTGAANIPVGSLVDTRKGRVALTSTADTGGKKVQTADFYDGIFQVKQAVPKKKPKKAKALITDIVLKGQLARSACAPLKGARSATADKKKGPKSVLGKLWGSGKGKFRTSGKYSSATVRGTIWLTQDECDGTLTKVRRGTVQVRDFKRKKTVTVKAGHSYLARAARAAAKSKRR
jgi:FG-GAP-like repeat